MCNSCLTTVVPQPNHEKPKEEKERLYRKYFGCNHDNKQSMKTYYSEEKAGDLADWIRLPGSQQLVTLILDDIACVECQKKFDNWDFSLFCLKEELGK